ncbi:uncharacterized protein MYCFIDRAFT_179899 [Pseudocercospora fijiensis CIRAD86]|uniref:Uncharacterized protein n=1 Tax=Pseudocercospora fijiensis (strain CIRAD86) TaxID=383855 RepID=M2ZDZ1_PSEFD|nr:uncharacterized protein MYCFIDRAFT_179899 [Pseudocercospora fijiensis CIRAD86]EME77324.1 hypothetical protein MYCFIDRAFT_179899 [Pseudocercospora fijiensis CIRAD86]
MLLDLNCILSGIWGADLSFHLDRLCSSGSEQRGQSRWRNIPAVVDVLQYIKLVDSSSLIRPLKAMSAGCDRVSCRVKLSNHATRSGQLQPLRRNFRFNAYDGKFRELAPGLRLPCCSYSNKQSDGNEESQSVLT